MINDEESNRCEAFEILSDTAYWYIAEGISTKATRKVDHELVTVLSKRFSQIQEFSVNPGILVEKDLEVRARIDVVRGEDLVHELCIRIWIVIDSVDMRTEDGLA